MLLVFVGTVVVFFAGTMMIQGVMQRHYRVLFLTEETKRYQVRDLRPDKLETEEKKRYQVRDQNQVRDCDHAVVAYPDDTPLLQRQRSYPPELDAF